MKKLLLSVAIVALMGSCKKEDEAKPAPAPVACTSKCGLIISDDVTDYSIVIRNDCSNNTKKFYLAEGDWMNAHVGSNICMSGVATW